MSPEKKGELPTGYIWRECSSIKAKFPMPQDWFFKAETAPGTQGFFMTREPIHGESFIKQLGEVSLKTTRPEGYLKTGLAINVLPDFYRRTKRSPAAVARNFMNNPPKEMMPTSQFTRFKDGPLITLRRFFRSEALIVMGRKMDPTNYYIEFTAKELTGTMYNILFETPSEKWQEDAAIARIMIENRVLDKSL